VSHLTVWRDGVAAGPENMAADEVLAAEAAREAVPLLRLYRWSETTASLGAFQPIAAARATPSLAGIPLVRRPSGGGTILHGSDLTYAVAVPAGHRWSRAPQALYDAVHMALVRVLVRRGIPARQHPGRPAAEDESRSLCFDRRAAGDVVVSPRGCAADSDGAKVLGSAQRRLPGAVLQHGSLLVAANAGLAEAVRHPGLRELWGDDAGPEAAVVAEWLAEVAAADDREVEERSGGFAAGRGDAIAAAAGRFSEPRWTERR